MEKKKVLIITYYWPPSGGAGVQRWLKFSKYLPENGWEPVIFTPENPEAPVEDHSLLRDVPDSLEVIKTPIWEPYRFYKKFVGMKPGERINAGFLSEKEKPPIKESIARWIRGNAFIPDARKFWIRPSVRYLKKYLSSHPVDVVISTGPPHSMHLIPLKLKRYFNIPWIADFRDPWIHIDFYDQLKLSSWAHKKHLKLERNVLKSADKVIVLGPTMGSYVQQQYYREPKVISNGYDPGNFANRLARPDPDFTLTHVGSMNKDRNHEIFWKTISELLEKDRVFSESLKINLIGKNDISVDTFINQYGLRNHINTQAYLPHDQIANKLINSWLLYLPINNTPNSRSIQTAKPDIYCR